MPFKSHNGVFDPSDIELLQRVFDQVAGDRGLAQLDEQGREDLAGEVVRAFQRGVTDETELRAALRNASYGGKPRPSAEDVADAA